MERNALTSKTGRCNRSGRRAAATIALLVLAAMGKAVARPGPMDVPAGGACIGRFLVNALPAPAAQPLYIHTAKRVTTRHGIGHADFQQLLAARESELRQARHRDGGSMWIGSTRLDDTAVVQTSWLSDSSRAGQLQELHIHDPAQRVLFLVSAQTDAARLPAAIDNLRALRPRIHYRDAATLPTGPGFCIDSGFIRGARLNTEELTVALQVPGHAGAGASLMSRVVGRPDRGLLQRAGVLPAGTVRLRAGKHSVDGLAGEELLVRSDTDDGPEYRFLWEFQGQPESLQRPFLSLQLGTQTATAFSSDEEALQVWDQLLGSLRTRPGAD